VAVRAALADMEEDMGMRRLHTRALRRSPDPEVYYRIRHGAEFRDVTSNKIYVVEDGDDLVGQLVGGERNRVRMTGTRRIVEVAPSALELVAV